MKEQTVLDKLRSHELKCPCGGTVYCEYDVFGTALTIHCTDCAEIKYPSTEESRLRQIPKDRLLEMVTDWLVLTGGPVPGRIDSPDPASSEYLFVGNEYPDGGEWIWYFRPLYRDRATIRSWLESPWEAT